MRTTRYVAFLRGINVGKKTVNMGRLREALAELGYTNIQTLLNSGNVIFETTEQDRTSIVQTIERKLEQTFGFPIPVILRTVAEIHALVDSNPFQSITVTPETRLYVTFLPEKPSSSLKLPDQSAEQDFGILRVTDTEVCSVLTLSEKQGTTDAMKLLEKTFGKNVTTRNWNTVTKIISA